MITEFPNSVTIKGTRRFFYTSNNYIEGIIVKLILITPNLKELLPITLTEFKYGLYYFEYEFKMIGNYVGIFFENDEHVGETIFRISL